MGQSVVELMERGRRIIRTSRHAYLASRFEPGSGDPDVEFEATVPFSSLVAVGFDVDGTPLMMLSKLALHRRNIEQTPAASLLFDGTPGMADRLAGPRITVVGRVERCSSERAKQRFVAQNPAAEIYADFADFAMFKLSVASAHFVAGFGAIRWIPAEHLLMPTDMALAIAQAVPALLETARDRFGPALLRHLGLGAAAEPRIAAIDATGIDVTYLDGETPVSRYLPFEAPATDADGLQRAIETLFS